MDVVEAMMPESGARLFEELMRFRPEGLSANAWAVKAGVSRTIWADLRRHGNPSRKTLEKLLGAAGSSLAEFEALRVEALEPSPAGVADALAEKGGGWRGSLFAEIPQLLTRLAGEWGEPGSGIELLLIDRATVIGKVDRPAALAADPAAYAVTMAGESMWPRFRAGRRLLVSPAARVEVGDDVLVDLGGHALIGELVSHSAGKIELRQYNPDVTFEVRAAGIAAMQRVAGEVLSL
jgi:phage repressor protein C with HTH and peptisase S24 domain